MTTTFKKGRTLTTTVDGRTYEIPDMWLVGATRTMTLRQAVAWWIAQERADELAQANR